MDTKVELSPKYSYLNLFVWIVALLLVAPLFEGRVGGTLVNVFFSFVVLSAVYTLSDKKNVRVFAAFIAVAALAFNWLGYFYPGLAWNVLTILFSMAFIGLAIGVLFRGIFSFEEMNFDRIFGALCIYFLIGLFWALLYSLNELLVPQSYMSDFLGEIGVGDDVMYHFNHFIYFSFVTLTTLGFGDMVPVTAEARNLSIVEAVAGQFYIATIVAAIIGTIIRNKKN